MITGSVNANREARIRIVVEGPTGDRAEIDAVLDTGFNGFLTLPFAVVRRLELTRLGCGRALLADGSEALFDFYEGIVLWSGKPRIVELEATQTAALVGMAMLERHMLTIDVTDGGRVVIESLP